MSPALTGDSNSLVKQEGANPFTQSSRITHFGVFQGTNKINFLPGQTLRLHFGVSSPVPFLS